MCAIGWEKEPRRYVGKGATEAHEIRSYTILKIDNKWKLFYDGRRVPSLHPTLKSAKSAAEQELLHVYSTGVFSPLFREVGI